MDDPNRKIPLKINGVTGWYFTVRCEGGKHVMVEFKEGDSSEAALTPACAATTVTWRANGKTCTGRASDIYSNDLNLRNSHVVYSDKRNASYAFFLCDSATKQWVQTTTKTNSTYPADKGWDYNGKCN